MESRFGLWLGASVLAGLAAVGIEASARPAAQVDIWVSGPIAAGPAQLAAAADAGVAAAVSRLGPERSDAVVRRAPGEAAASVSSIAPLILRQVTVEAVAADRIRIRVAADDLAAARTVANEVGAALGGQGVRERLRIESEATGGRIVLIARLLALAALVVLGATALAVAARRVGAGWSAAPAR
jgi:hypothetical protein